MTTPSIKMRVLTEVSQKEIEQLYKDMDSCSYLRNIVPQTYTDQKEWPIYLDNIFINLIDKGHVPLISVKCLKCKEDSEYILIQYKDYDDFVKAASDYKGNA